MRPLNWMNAGRGQGYWSPASSHQEEARPMVGWSTVEKALGATEERGPAGDAEKGKYSGSSLSQSLLPTEPAGVQLTREFGEYSLRISPLR